MKKKNIINLIKYYADKNDAGFKSESYEIAKEFSETGDEQLAEYIMALISGVNTFVPQTAEKELEFLKKIDITNDMLLLSDSITQDLLGIANAVSRNVGINKFLFQGVPGTGKTEASKQMARILDRDIYIVDFSEIIDSKLGQTQKNIASLFDEISSFNMPEKKIVLFDEIDALALDRTNANDVREMGRATTAVLKGMDHLDSRVVLIATTNLFEHFDKAFMRRFDFIVNFNRYSQKDLMTIAEKILDTFLLKFKLANKDIRLFRKILSVLPQLPYPGELKNMVRTAVAFSAQDDGTEYFRRLYSIITGKEANDLSELQKQNFTIREMGILTQKSKSTIARELKEVAINE